jgi:hypothetical protein
VWISGISLMRMVKVGRLHSSVLERKLLDQCGTQAIHDRAFELRISAIRLHDKTGIGHDPVVMDLDLARLLVERDLRHARRQRIVVVRERDAHAAARTLAGKIGHLRHRLEHSIGTRLVFRQLKPQRKRVLAGRLRHLVEKGFGRELVVAGADSAPCVHAHAASSRTYSARAFGIA